MNEEVEILQRHGLDMYDSELQKFPELSRRSRVAIGKKRIALGLLKEAGTRRREEEISVAGEHARAIEDFPSPLGWCSVCEAEAICSNCGEVDYVRVAEAMDRARIDHSNIPYSKELVLSMCRTHNLRHTSNGFVILFEVLE